jgi:hypothetical protein
MGYETRLYIGAISSISKDTYFSIFAMVDLCKTGTLIDDNDRNDGISVYFYGTDGNTKITEDLYGQALKAYPITKVKNILKKYIEEDYARYSWAYETILAITKKRKGKHAQQATHCILFGH